MSSSVSVRGVRKDYGDAVVIERLNLEVAPGSFVAIVGASGCGKSTFLRMLVGQEQPDRGEILIDGMPIPPEPSPERGVVFQRYSVFPHLTVTQNLMLPAELAASKFFGRVIGPGRRKIRDSVADTLKSIGLWEARDRCPLQLSGGMQQRLAIAQALVMRPKILLLDEPFGALDPGIRGDMHAIILKLWRETKMTIFMVTHDIAEGFKLATRLLVFDKVRHDPDFPSAYGSTVTYDLPLDRAQRKAETAAALAAVEATRTEAALAVVRAATAPPSAHPREELAPDPIRGGDPLAV